MPRPTHRPGNLPAEATRFVGRRHELAEVRKRLTAARLVSLVGPGGVGKTRITIRIATDLGRAFPGGVWLVELAELQDPALVSNAFMASVDLRDQAATEPLACSLRTSSTGRCCWFSTASVAVPRPLGSRAY